MQTSSLEFPHNARTTYTAIKHLFETKQTSFSNVRCNDDLFTIEACHGMWISPFTEKIKIKVVATDIHTCRVVVESSSRSILNMLNYKANMRNVSELSDCIKNEAYKIHQTEDIIKPHKDNPHSAIKFIPSNIKFR